MKKNLFLFSSQDYIAFFITCLTSTLLLTMKSSLILFFPRRIRSSFTSNYLIPSPKILDSHTVCPSSFSLFSFLQSSLLPFSSPYLSKDLLPVSQDLLPVSQDYYTQQLITYNQSLPSNRIEGRVIKSFFEPLDTIKLNHL
jgi:hypothetical protein